MNISTLPRGRGAVSALFAVSMAACSIAASVHAATEPPARLPDTSEQRVAACIACHGREGAASTTAYFPRLSGKPAGYLFNQLRSFRDGRRQNTDMAYLVRNMSDDYLHEIAGYFAGLDLPYPPVAASSDASDATLQRGRQLVFEGDAARGLPACAQCHGDKLTGVQPGIPALVGLPRLYLASQLGDWLSDNRHALAPDCMTAVGRKLSAADINAVTSWLALQPVPADPKAQAALQRPLPMACSAIPN